MGGWIKKHPLTGCLLHYYNGIEIAVIKTNLDEAFVYIDFIVLVVVIVKLTTQNKLLYTKTEKSEETFHDVLAECLHIFIHM